MTLTPKPDLYLPWHCLPDKAGETSGGNHQCDHLLPSGPCSTLWKSETRKVKGLAYGHAQTMWVCVCVCVYNDFLCMLTNAGHSKNSLCLLTDDWVLIWGPWMMDECRCLGPRVWLSNESLCSSPSCICWGWAIQNDSFTHVSAAWAPWLGCRSQWDVSFLSVQLST